MLRAGDTWRWTAAWRLALERTSSLSCFFSLKYAALCRLRLKHISWTRFTFRHRLQWRGRRGGGSGGEFDGLEHTRPCSLEHTRLCSHNTYAWTFTPDATALACLPAILFLGTRRWMGKVAGGDWGRCSRIFISAISRESLRPWCSRKIGGCEHYFHSCN